MFRLQLAFSVLENPAIVMSGEDSDAARLHGLVASVMADPVVKSKLGYAHIVDGPYATFRADTFTEKILNLTNGLESGSMFWRLIASDFYPSNVRRILPTP